MKFAATSVVAAALSCAYARPASLNARASTPNDTDVLNFALTLEHLELFFYTTGLQNFSDAAFQKAGYSADIRGRFSQIKDHETTHVAFLQNALGSAAVKPCNYSFPVTDVKSFVQVSDSLETVGASAYLGAEQLLTDKINLAAAGAIQSTEARQSSWINSAVRKGTPWSSAFEISLGMQQVFSIAHNFIVSCPSTNAPLMVTPFPALTLPNNTAPGSNVTATFNATGATSSQLYAAFITGLPSDTMYTPLSGSSGNYTVSVPKELRGVVYTFIVNNKTDNQAPTDNATVAGPVMLDFEFDGQGKLETLS